MVIVEREEGWGLLNNPELLRCLKGSTEPHLIKSLTWDMRNQREKGFRLRRPLVRDKYWFRFDTVEARVFLAFLWGKKKS